MVRRSAIGNVTQLQVEVTLGTDPAGTRKRMKSLALPIRMAAEASLFRAASGLFPAVHALNREWTQFDIPDAPPLFDEIVYPLSSIIQAATITTPGGGTASRQWVFTMPTTGGLTPKSYTVEYGSSVGAEKAVGCIVNEFHVNKSRRGLQAGGNGFGQLFTVGSSLSGSPASLANKPILASKGDVWVDTTWGGLGTTKLTADFVANLSIANRWGQIWPINSAKTSWDEPVEAEPTVRYNLQVENNAAGQAFVTNLRNSSKAYLRYKSATADFIEGAIPWSYQEDFVGVVLEAPSPAEAEGLHVLNVVLGAFDDGTNPPLTITVVNSTTAL